MLFSAQGILVILKRPYLLSSRWLISIWMPIPISQPIHLPPTHWQNLRLRHLLTNFLPPPMQTYGKNCSSLYTNPEFSGPRTMAPKQETNRTLRISDALSKTVLRRMRTSRNQEICIPPQRSCSSRLTRLPQLILVPSIITIHLITDRSHLLSIRILKPIGVILCSHPR
jgi:hypothetical protein